MLLSCLNLALTAMHATVMKDSGFVVCGLGLGFRV